MPGQYLGIYFLVILLTPARNKQLSRKRRDRATIRNFITANQKAIVTESDVIDPDKVFSMAKFSITSQQLAMGTILDKTKPVRTRTPLPEKVGSITQPIPIDREYSTRKTKSR